MLGTLEEVLGFLFGGHLGQDDVLRGLFAGVARRALAHGSDVALWLRVVIVYRRQSSGIKVLMQLLLAMSTWHIKLRSIRWLVTWTSVVILLLLLLMLLVVIVPMLAALIALT